MPRMVRTSLAVGEIEQHLAATESAGTSVDAYLTQYLLILLCAEMQEEVGVIVAATGARVCNGTVAEFVAQSCGRVLRSVGKEEIAKLAGMFGSETRERLNSALTDEAVTTYSNAVVARHKVAHKTGATVTLREVKDAAAAAEGILNALEAALA